MVKSELIAVLSKETGFPEKEVTIIVDKMLNKVVEVSASNEKVSLMGFGSFAYKHHPAHKGRNPKTGETVNIPACNRPTFKPSQLFKDKVNAKKSK